MFAIVKKIADVQEKLNNEADEDYDNGHRVKACLKAGAIGALDGVFINGVMLTALGIFGVGVSVYNKVRNR